MDGVVTKKSEELRPVMTRIPEGLRLRLERSAGSNGRSMNAEIIHRLEQSFSPDADVVQREMRLHKVLKKFTSAIGELQSEITETRNMLNAARNMVNAMRNTDKS